MTLQRPSSVAVLALLALAAPARAAQVWVVAPAPAPGVDFTSIQDAISAAAPGDIVLVRDGSYSGYLSITGKALTIVADAATKPVIASGGRITILQVPAGSTAALRGFTIPGESADPLAVDDGTLWITTNPGSVLVEDCAVGGSGTAMDASANGYVGISSSSLVGKQEVSWGLYVSVGRGLHAASSLVGLHASTVQGAPGVFSGLGATGLAFDGGDGVQLDSGTLIASRSTLQGGAGLGSMIDGYAVCSYSHGGCALLLWIGAPSATHAATDLYAGSNGPTAPPCLPMSPTPPTQVMSGTLTAAGGTAPLLACDALTREGQTLDVTLSSAAGEFGVLLVATGLQPVLIGEWVGVLASPGASILPLGLAGAGGSVSLSAPITELGAGVEGAVVYLQGGSCELATLTCRLSNVGVAAAVDASF